MVDYIFSQLAPWINELPAGGRRVYEPTCGHAPFLLGALRLLSATKHCTTLSDEDRHIWLKERLRGSEIDDFAREVARLSLTLADIPNPNGWHLDDGDLFAGSLMEDRIREADIIVANPPFESKAAASGVAVISDDLSPISCAAEMLRRITRTARPGTLVGFVMPQTLLDSPRVTALRAALRRDFEWKEILRLPDKGVFKIADVESAVLIGRRLRAGKSRVPHIATTFKNVAEDDVTRFVKEGVATVEQTHLLSEADPASDCTMLLPDLADIWDHLKNTGCLSTIADVGQGFSFKSESDTTFPPNQTQISATKRVGYSLGFYDFPKGELTHQVPRLVWLNRNRAAIRPPRSGYADGIPQVVLNYAPISRGPWRIAAYIDSEGRPATSRFLVVRPLTTRYSLEFLWAVLNSPEANAFSKCFTSKRDILAGTMRELPIPVPSDAQLRDIEAAARAYRTAACANRTISHHTTSRTRRAIPATSTPDLPGLLNDTEETSLNTEADTLLHLHWKMDAAVLRLYQLPPSLERRLLDYFAGRTRGRVPFDQNEYIPKKFTGIHTLKEMLALTADWPSLNVQRSLLIEKEYRGVITPSELKELEHLQNLASLRRQLIAPYPQAELEQEIERLKREGKWDE